MKYELWYSVVVRDRNGKVVSRERRKARSFLKQWNQLVRTQLSGANLSFKDTSGAARSVGYHENNFMMNAGVNNATFGIVIGTGNTPVAIDDYALETQIAHGTGAGQMSHGICTVATSVVAAPSCSFLVSRTITNNSPAEITVREAGIYVKIGSMEYQICVTRDVFGAPQAVPIAGTITVNWTIQVTV